MSVYQKFIDSATRSASSSVASSPQVSSQVTRFTFDSARANVKCNEMLGESGFIRSARFESHCLCRASKAQNYQYCHSNCRPDPSRAIYCGHIVQDARSTFQQPQSPRPKKQTIESIVQTNDPVLLQWLKAIRFETDLEGLTALQARTLTIDEYSAGALSVRNSQVAIQTVRSNSQSLLEFIDKLIDFLPLNIRSSFRDDLSEDVSSIPLTKFQIEFSELWRRLMDQTVIQSDVQTGNVKGNPNSKLHHLTITNCSPRKSAANSMTVTRPLDKLRAQLRNICMELANHIDDAIMFEEEYDAFESSYERQRANIIDNCFIESSLRKIKEVLGKFVEISIRAECANIVRALEYDFSQSSLNRLSSNASLRPTRPFESSSAQLPLKWALIALWQLTKDDSYLCRTLTEKWQTLTDNPEASGGHRVAKRLDYSTKYDKSGSSGSSETAGPADASPYSSIRSDYEKFYQICQRQHNLPPFEGIRDERENDENSQYHGALRSALKSRQEQQNTRQLSTIELLIDIIISQPNKHERLDVMNFVHHQAQNDRLIDVDEWDQSLNAAIYTSNQYKVAALRILNHLCVNDQAAKTILKCFSTPPPSPSHPNPENKIIKSIFECYQKSQDHIYQNETTLQAHSLGYFGQRPRRGLKRSHQARQLEELRDDYSDSASRNLRGNHTESGHQCDDQMDANDSGTTDSQSGGDDLVVREALMLIIQLTNSFHSSSQGHDYYTLIGRFSIDLLVNYLTQIVKSSPSREMIHLALSALANISFITTEPIKHHGTNRIVLEMFWTSRKRSKDLDLRDQAVTILANTADKNIPDIVNNGGLKFLLSCLESCPTRMANYKQNSDKLMSSSHSTQTSSTTNNLYENAFCKLRMDDKPRDRRPINFGNQYPDALDSCACDGTQNESYELVAINGNYMARSSPPNLNKGSRLSLISVETCLDRLSTNELAAIERIHQKTAIAFARMSVDSSTTRMIHEYGGVKQMIDLCKFSNKRNHSVTVLMACSAALKKMSKVLDMEVFKYHNALDLIELEMNKILDIYGSSHGRQQHRLLASEV